MPTKDLDAGSPMMEIWLAVESLECKCHQTCSIRGRNNFQRKVPMDGEWKILTTVGENCVCVCFNAKLEC